MVLQQRPFLHIKGLLGRAKSQLNKKDTIKGILSMCEALKLFLNSKLIGQERIEVDYLIAELVQIISTIPEIREYLPEGFKYVKGEEKRLLQDLVKMVKNILKEMEEGEELKARKEEEEKKKRLLDMLQRYLLNKDAMGSANAINKILKEYGGSAEVLADVAERFYQAKDYEQTIRFCKESLKKDPRNMQAFRILINAYRNLGRYEDAERCYKKTLKVFGEHGNIYFNLAKLYKEWGKIKEAKASISKALKLEPSNSLYQKFAQEIISVSNKG